MKNKRTFIFEECKVNTHGFLFGNLVNDLFVERKSKKNHPLIQLVNQNGDVINPNAKIQTDVLFPGIYLETHKEKGDYLFFEITSIGSQKKTATKGIMSKGMDTNSSLNNQGKESNTNTSIYKGGYSIGNSLIDNYIKKDVQSVILNFENRIHNLLYEKVTLITQDLPNRIVKADYNEIELREYLNNLWQKISAGALDQNSALSIAYHNYIKKNQLDKLLARVIILSVIASKPLKESNKYYIGYSLNNNYIGQTKITLDSVLIPLSDADIFNAKSYSNIDREETYIRIKNHFENKNYSQSLKMCEKIFDLISHESKLSGQSFERAELIKLLYCEHLLNGFGYKKENVQLTENSPEVIKAKKILFGMLDNGAACLLLYYYYNGKFNITGAEDSREAEFHLKVAGKLGCAEAILIRVEIILSKPNINDTDKKTLEKLITQLDNKETQINKIAVARYHFNKARYYELLGENEKAFKEYKAAEELGHEVARKILKRKDTRPREIKEYDYQSHSSSSDKICIINTLNEQTKALINTLPHEYMVWSVGKESSFLFGNSVSQSFTSIGDCIKALFRIVFKNDSLNINSKVMFALFSDEEEQNIDASLQILDYLYNKALEKECFSNLEFINIFDIFVKADFETASPLLDASLSEMNPEIYFKTHICDSALMASRELLEKKPLFTPEGNKTSVLIIGNSNVCRKVFREAFAVGYMGKKHEFDFIIANNDIEKTIREIEDAMPYIHSNLKSNPKICFANAEIPFMPKEKAKYKEDIPTAWEIIDFSQALYLANYIIIDIGSDIENINYAVKLRRWYARNYIQSRKDPVINVSCQSPVNEYWAERMALDNTKQGNAWHNSFHLNFFGSLNSNYSFSSLTSNKLEKTAEKIHCSYFGTDTNNIEALNALYSFSYNMDSSIVTALGLNYRFYIAGCFDDEINNKYEITDRAKARYKKWLDENNDYACEIEQYRWNCFEISRGWSGLENQTDLEKYLNYPQLDNHKYSLAMLHPYIANWDDLDDDGNIFRAVDSFYRRLGKTKSSPKTLTKENVATTLKWLDFEKEEALEQSEENKEIEKDE